MYHWFYCLPWQNLLVIMPFATVAYGSITLLDIFKKRIAKMIVVLLFIVCLFLIFWTTILHREVGNYGTFQPLFESYREALNQPERYRSNFMNIILFFPAGMFLFNIIPCKKKILKFLTDAFALSLLSIIIECTQYFFSVGTAEMDDIMHNTLGAFFGAGAAWFAPWAAHAVMAKFKGWRQSYEQAK